MINQAGQGKRAEPHRILLVDDHPMVRERLAEIISRETDLQVCGEAEDRNDALEVTEATQPDLAVVDITLKTSDGLELVKDMRSRWPNMSVLVVSMHDESLYAERVIRAGAMGYITKQEATRNILQAIRTVIRGEVYLNQKIATRIISRMTLHKVEHACPTELLADRELQVFELTGRGLNAREIAERLKIGVSTVETYRSRIREKLSLRDSGELLRTAISWARGK
jgi:DNA-binding NarL/FixJ family response regulator